MVRKAEPQPLRVCRLSLLQLEASVIPGGKRTGEPLSLGGSKGKAWYKLPERNADLLSGLRTNGTDSRAPDQLSTKIVL